jgi:PKD repeat protein
MDRSLFGLLSVLVLYAMIGGYVTCADEIQGVIYINSEPVGADIFLIDPSSSIDGLSVEDLIDITPKQFSVEPGTYIIYLKKYGYISWWTEITVTSEEILNLGTIPLEPQESMYGALHIETNPADATIVLEREVPDIESKVHGKTPLSLESLPKGTYRYTITKDGYEDVTGVTEVVVGEVSEVAVALTQLALTEPVRFNSLPVGAEVYIIPCIDDCNELDLETLDVAEIKEKTDYVGYIGYTPTTFEMPNGKWGYLMSKDSYHPVSGTIFVTVGTPIEDVNRELTPFPQNVEVYFESVQDEVTIYYHEKELGTTPCWVSLPAEMITELTFSKRFYDDLKISVDTSLFKGRSSKWGKLTELQQSMYTITSQADDHSTISPAGTEFVLAGECAPQYVIDTESRDYQIKVDGIKLNGKPIMDLEDYTDNVVLNKDDACDDALGIRVVENNMILSVESEQKTYAIDIVVGPGGTAVNREGTPYSTSITVLSGEDSPEFFFTPAEGYVLFKVLMNGIEQEIDAEQWTGVEQWIKEGNGPYFFDKVRANYRIEAQFRPTHVAITPIVGDHGTMSPAEPYLIEYGGCTELHELFPAEGYVGKFDIHPTVVGKQDVETEATNPRTSQFRVCEITQDLTVEASFSPLLFDIEAVAYGNGKIDPSGLREVEYMSSQTFTTTPDDGNSLMKLLDNGVDVGTQSQYVLLDITEDHKIEAFFTGASDYLTITPRLLTGGGAIEPSEPQIVTRGEDISFTITADSCHTIGSIVITDIENGLETEEEVYSSPQTVTLENVQFSHDIAVSFVPKLYTINVIQSPGGTIEPLGLVSVECGGSETFTITPDPNSLVQFLIVDNAEIDGTEKYTFSNVIEDHTFSARFVSPPEPNFSSDLIRAPPKYPVKFNDFTKNSPTDVLWDFGDGEVSREREPTHYYASTGIYTVRLTAFNAASPAGITVVKENYIEITTNPIAKFTVKPEIGMTPPGFTVKMTDLSLNAETKDKVTFAWDFGDGKGSSIGRNPSYTYTSPGVYKVGLKVEKPYLAADYYYETITILQEPIAGFSAHPLSGPAPLTVQFEDKSQGFPTSWFWTFGDETGSYDVAPRHVYAKPGEYTVTLTVTSDEGSDVKVIEKLITVTQ